MVINSRFVKLSGKFNIPDELRTGADYEVSITGSIPDFRVFDNHDGTHDITYNLKPHTGQIIAQKGATTPLKDPRRQSVKFRAMISHIWGEDYDRVMDTLLANGDELRDFYERIK